MKPKYFSKAVTIGLFDGCNLQCAHCYRPVLKNPVVGTFKLTYKEICTSLNEISEFQKNQEQQELKVYFTGGEPALWHDEGKDLVDLLILVATQYQSRPRFDTNGSYFVDTNWCTQVFDRYFAETDMPIKLTLSCDTFHHGKLQNGMPFRSYDKTTDTLPALDTILQYAKQHGKLDKLDIEIMWVASTDLAHDLPSAITHRYRNVRFTVVPLRPEGRGENLRDKAPKLRVCDSNGLPVYDRSCLGPYLKYLVEQLKGKTKKPLDQICNKEVFQILSECGELPNPLFCWNKEYYYCIPRLGRTRYRIAEIGSLLNGIRSFYHPEIAGMHASGIISYLETLCNNDELMPCFKEEHLLRYLGCSFCCKLVE